MKRTLATVVALLGLAAGCRDFAAPPQRRLAGRPPVLELAPARGTAPRNVQDGDRVIRDRREKVGVITAASSDGLAMFHPNMRYDPTTEVTIRGPIVGYRRIPLSGDRTGLFLRVSAGGEVSHVYLGPEEWLVLHDIYPDMTKQVLVTGSRAELGEQIVIMARKIVLNGADYHLRNQAGHPYWTEPIVRERAAAQAGKQPAEAR